jgi:hypothetical protein
MAKGKKKKAAELTTNEALNRLFGKGAAKTFRQVLAAEDARKPKKKTAK